MTAIGVSEIELERLRPQDVAHYLSSRGWRAGIQVRYSRRWERDWAGRTLRVLVPLDTDLADFADRMADLVGALAEMEGRPPSAVHQDLTLTGLDVQYIRTLPNTPSGTIPVQAGVLAMAGARDLLLAAASHTVEPRPVLPRRKSRAARDLVDRARFGPTVPGSYILSLQVPLPERRPQLSLFDDEPDPFARQVSRRMYEAVAAARTAAERAKSTGDPAPFTDASRAGVSADLCEALAGIGGDDDRDSQVHGFSIDFTWSPRWPVPPLPVVAPFTPSLVRTLREGAKDMRRQAPEPGVTIIGRSIKLKRAIDQGPGEVTVEAVVLGQAGAIGPKRQIHVHLNTDDYTRATDAHAQGRTLKIEGDLSRRGTYYELTQITAFDVL
ncbi:hypothetical protein [Streptomyces sp. NBC_00057]|uniref:hypothetical protein n=1 Tax=Streptomyces sp. NBC_00057 TaxID=2975634 RepID=UPI0032551353